MSVDACAGPFHAGKSNERWSSTSVLDQLLFIIAKHGKRTTAVRSFSGKFTGKNSGKKNRPRCCTLPTTRLIKFYFSTKNFPNPLTTRIVQKWIKVGKAHTQYWIARREQSRSTGKIAPGQNSRLAHFPLGSRPLLPLNEQESRRESVPRLCIKEQRTIILGKVKKKN